MFNRIRKQKKSSSIFKKTFLSKVIIRSKEISIYENYFERDFRFYIISPLDSMQYMKYVRSSRSKYDILKPTTIQLETLSSTYVRLKIELKDAFKKQM